jgi:aminocarboxymuconate-semialdehyde decarboxylase
MIVDWHAHAYPPEIASQRRWGKIYPLMIENLLEAHERAGIDLCVVSNTLHYIKGKPPAEALGYIRRWNEYAAEVQQRHSDRTVAFASALPGGGKEFIAETERAIRQYGLKGILINSSHNGDYPDDDAARPFFELITDLDVPVMIHAPTVSFGEERMREYRLASSIGRPFDGCLSIARMIVRGVLEQFPKAKIVGCHLGGGICEVIGRMDYAYELGDAASGLGPYEPMMIKHAPSHYLKRMYFDTVSYHAPAVMCAIQTVGADRLVFGSDAPPLLPMLPKAKKLIEELPIGAAEKEAILGKNALKLLKRF